MLDYPSDTESSLSRSSSLIQFESLERQLQNDLSFSSSSPLLNVGLTTINNHSTQSAAAGHSIPVIVDQDFERFIPLQQQQLLAQNQLQHHLLPVTVSIKTKVSSLDNNSVVSATDKHQYRHNNGGAAASTLSTFSNPSTFTATTTNRESQLRSGGGISRTSTFERIASSEERDHERFSSFRGKSSQEELSEDSGYCGGDLSQLQSIGSSTSDNFSSKQSASSDELDCSLIHTEKVGEEEEVDDEEVDRERGLKITGKRERRSPNNNEEVEDDDRGDAISRGVEHQVGCGGLSRSCIDEQEEEDDDDVMEVAINIRENKRNPRRKKNIPFGIKKKMLLGGCQRIASRSLPNIFLNHTASADQRHQSAAQQCSGESVAGAPKGDQTASVGEEEFLKVNSFPEGLNYLLSGSYSDSEGDAEEDSDECMDFEENQEFFSNDYYYLQDNHGAGAGEDFFFQDTVTFGGTIAAKNIDLNQFVVSPQNSRGGGGGGGARYQSPPDPHQVLQQQSRAGILSASYSNLTALDYSEGSPTRLFTKMDSGSNSKRSAARPTIANPEITLLDEISFNFDKNLSIINDRCGNFEPLIEDEHGEEEEEADAEMAPVIGILNIKRPPKPPPRRYRKGDSAENLTVPKAAAAATSSNASSRESLTFDRDPTNLITCYAASLERCNFQTLDQPTTLPPFCRNGSATSLQQPMEVVGPKAAAGGHKEMVVSTPNLSNRQEMQIFGIDIDDKARTIGNVSSRGSLYKEVSFNPIVSEISWRQHDEMQADSLSEDSLNGDHGSDSDEESDGGKYREEAEDYFGLKKNENFKDLDLTDASQKSVSPPVLATTAAVADIPVDTCPSALQTITIRKTNIILTPVSTNGFSITCRINFL